MVASKLPAPAAELDHAGTPRRFPAWGLSVLMHTCLLLAFAALLHFAPKAPVGESERSVGVALVRENNGEREYQTAEDAQESQAARATNDSQQALPQESELAVDLSDLFPADVDLAAGAGAFALPDPGDAGSRAAAGDRLSGKVSTSVFGVSGTGTKFAYVFDRSGSMEGYGGLPLASAKRELIGSLGQLNDVCQFQVIFYNERPKIFQPNIGTPRLAFGNEHSKQEAIEFVRGINAMGGTRHLSALRLALGLRPDVVFFLTDADEPRLTSDEMRQIRVLNKGSIINTIEFGYGPQHRMDNFLVQLAKQNGGQHIYVDVRRLPRG